MLRGSNPNEARRTVTLIQKLNELIAGIEIAMLTTQSSNNQMESRPMVTQAATDDGCLWFFSAQDSSKVDDVHNNNEVNVAYADPINMRFVSVSGTCELVRSHTIARELWRPSYNRWFPRGVDDPELILLKVTVNAAEYWDAHANRMRPVQEDLDAQHATLVLRDERHEVG